MPMKPTSGLEAKHAPQGEAEKPDLRGTFPLRVFLKSEG